MSSSTLRRPAPHQFWPRGSAPLLLDNISVPATNAYSCARKLRTAYAGAAFRVRRDSDNTELSIGFIGNVVDTAALLTFVGAGSGFVVTLYDQSTNGRDLIQTTPASQPRIVNAGVFDAHPSGRIAMAFDGTDDRLQRAVTGNTTGLTGNPNITVGSTFRWGDASSVPWGFGKAGAGANAQIFALIRVTAGMGNITKTHFNTDRAFIPVTNPDTDGRYYVVQHTAGATTHTGVIRQNGTGLTQGAAGGSALALNLLDESLELCNYTAAGAGRFMQGNLNAFMLFNAVLAGSDLAALETELAAHV